MNPKVHNKLPAGKNKQGLRTPQANNGGDYLANLLDQISDALISTDMDSRVVGWNAAAENIYGWKSAEVFGRISGEILQTEYLECTRDEVIQTVLEKGVWKGEATQNRKNGERFPVMVSISQFKDQTGKPIGFLTVNRDITERKQGEKTPRESENKISTILNNLPVGVSILDQDRKLVYSNKALEKILETTSEGLLRGDYRNRKYLRADGSERPSEEFASTRVFTEKTELHDVITGVVKEDGKVIWTSISAAPLDFPDWKVLLVTADITENKQTEERLRESERNLQNFINNSPDTIYVVDLSKHTIQFLNREEFLGYNKHELESENSIMSAIHPEDRAIVADQWKEMTTTGENQLTPVQYRAQNKNGGWEWIQQRVSILSRTEVGAPQNLLITLSVITERKSAGESLLQSEQKYANIFHISPMLMAITELGSSLYTEVNDTFLRTLGFTREEVVGHTVGELNLFVRPEQAVTALQIMQTQGTLSDFEVEVRAKSGMIHHGLFGAEFIELDGKRLFNNYYMCLQAAVNLNGSSRYK